MKITKQGQSIRWKIVLIYFLLVFIATMIIGVFLINQLEDYYTDSVRRNITNTVNEGALLSSFLSYEDLDENAQEIDAYIMEWGRSLGQEIFVVDSALSIVASSSESYSKNAIDILDCDVILESLSGEVSENFGTISFVSSAIPVMNMAFPIKNSKEETLGTLYFRADMSSVQDALIKARGIFVRAMLIALAITIVLGFFISQSITKPIREVTEMAESMSLGDFSQEVSVRSNDEIGQLADMFNVLREKLNDTLLQISSEKNKLETVLRHMVDPLIAVDLSGNIIHLNDSARDFLGFFEGQEIEQKYDEMIADINPDLLLDNMLKECQDEPVEDVFDYAGRSYAVRYDKVRDENHLDSGILMIIQDITERQKLENMQMDFVANVSHELKTPLTTIKSYTETLIDGVDDVEIQKNFLGIIDTEADRMNRLVKELLQLSRMENNQETWNKKEGSLTALLSFAVTKVELTAQGKKQQLNCLFSQEERLPVVIDKDKIEQVILNILSNAIKYTQEGGRIDIDAYQKGKNAIVIISDNGIGIPETELGRVFERFFRVDKARSRSMGGTGLGLSITKQIVEEHGGEIEIESKEGKGTKVSVSLPIAPSAARGRQLDD